MTIELNKLNSLRVIHTARDLKAINLAVDRGFFPLIRELKPSSMLNETIAYSEIEKQIRLKPLTLRKATCNTENTILIVRTNGIW